MDPARVKLLLEQVAARELSTEEAAAALGDLPLVDLQHTVIDTHRELRTGMPEVIFAAGKTAGQVVDIAGRMLESSGHFLATRVREDTAAALAEALPDCRHDPVAHAVWQVASDHAESRGDVAVVTAGTSDLPAAREAIATLDYLGAGHRLIADVGIAGLHRLTAHRATLDQADAIIAVAGMEGALPSVLAGLVGAPIIAVPTSVGYGASFGGLSALLTMLSSCAPGIAVVNIDNGFGAACAAHRILGRALSVPTVLE